VRSDVFASLFAASALSHYWAKPIRRRRPSARFLCHTTQRDSLNLSSGVTGATFPMMRSGIWWTRSENSGAAPMLDISGTVAGIFVAPVLCRGWLGDTVARRNSSFNHCSDPTAHISCPLWMRPSCGGFALAILTSLGAPTSKSAKGQTPYWTPISQTSRRCRGAVRKCELC
jgi:hypothetical protein